MVAEWERFCQLWKFFQGKGVANSDGAGCSGIGPTG